MNRSKQRPDEKFSKLIGPLGVLERLSYDKQSSVQTHYFLYTTS
jgi:hypothetical protein